MYKLGKKIGRQRSHALINKIIKNSINNKKSIMRELLNNKEISGYINKKQMKNFLNPLILKSKKDINYNNLFKGNLEGITTKDLNSI